MNDVLLSSDTFLDRRLVSLEKNQKISDAIIQCVYCTFECNLDVYTSGVRTSCHHMVQCNECRDYYIEKIIRCGSCCYRILGVSITSCDAQSCPRNPDVAKSSVYCPLCSELLLKDPKCCKKSNITVDARMELKNYLFVLVQDHKLIDQPTIADRPCSHYSLCQYCRNAITKGHRSTSSCKNCRGRIGLFNRLKKPSRIQLPVTTPYFPRVHFGEHPPLPNNELVDASTEEESKPTSKEDKMSIASLLDQHANAKSTNSEDIP